MVKVLKVFVPVCLMVLLLSTQVFAYSTPIGETSVNGVASVGVGQNLCFAWASKDSSHRINVKSTSDNKKVTLKETSSSRPALAYSYSDGEIYIAWRGMDNRLNVGVYDGKTVSNKVTLNERSYTAPAITSLKGKLYLAWTGTDKKLNTIQSPNGKNWCGKKTLADTSDYAPTLTADASKLYLGWAGTVNHLLNVMQSTDGRNWTKKNTFKEKSTDGPSIVWTPSLGFTISWVDSNRKCNTMYSSNGYDFYGKYTFTDCQTNSAPSVTHYVLYKYPCTIMVWTDSNSVINYTYLMQPY